ncbi:MAG: hypothetical protein K6U11_00605 [bacterium]|nr:hypothetical protein [bacterium]
MVEDIFRRLFTAVSYLGLIIALSAVIECSAAGRGARCCWQGQPDTGCFQARIAARGAACQPEGTAYEASQYTFSENHSPSCGWLKITTAHFVIHYLPVDEYFSKELASLAERAYTSIADHLDLHPSQKIDLYLADSRKLFTQLQPSPRCKVSEQAIGLAYPHLSRILLLSPRAAPAGAIDLEKTFRHELTHIILGASSSSPLTPIPHWFNEGLSMLEAKEWGWHYQLLLSRICLTGRFISFGQLDQSFPTDPDQLQIAYAQSISMITFILDKYGEDALRTTAHLMLRRAEGLDSALRQALGVNLDELEARWKRHLRLVYTWVPILTSSGALWFIISLIFLFGYYRKRKVSQERLSYWEEEEIEEWLRKQLDDLDLR